jgi:catechol 2,3-dioxygenase-like lactoylglutathione lyase family enzyme
MRGLDHLVLTVRDLDAAEARYRALGFTLTPRAHHPFGTSNNLAIFDGNFLELLGVSAPEKIPAHEPGRFSFGQHTAAFLQRGEGLSYVVLDTADARADHRAFQAAGLSTFEPLDFSRGAIQPDGSERTVAFTICFALPPEPAPPHFVCQQRHPPENFWRPEYQRHENGALQISEVVLRADRPGALAPFYRALFGSAAVAEAADRLVVETGRGRISALNEAALRRRFGLAGAHDGAIVAMRFAVADPAASRRRLERAGAPVAESGGAFRVGPEQACGALLEFAAR